MAKEYSGGTGRSYGLNQRIDYYRDRVLDRTLSSSQRTHASLWLDGVEQAKTDIKRFGAEEAGGKLKILNDLNCRSGGAGDSFCTGYRAVLYENKRGRKK